MFRHNRRSELDRNDNQRVPCYDWWLCSANARCGYIHRIAWAAFLIAGQYFILAVIIMAIGRHVMVRGNRMLDKKAFL
jgi:hypothetical protein